MTLRIATVRLFVDDMAAARAFYGGGCTIAGPPERQPRGGMPMHVADPRATSFRSSRTDPLSRPPRGTDAQLALGFPGGNRSMAGFGPCPGNPLTTEGPCHGSQAYLR